MSAKTAALNENIGHLDVPAPLCVEPGATLKEVYAAMQKDKSGCVLVCKGKKLVGIFTDRDLVLKTLGQLPASTPIEKVMSPDPAAVTGRTSLGEAVELMHAKGYRNLPVLDDQGQPAGLLTVRHIIKYLAAHYPAEVYNLPPKPDQVDSASEGA